MVGRVRSSAVMVDWQNKSRKRVGLDSQTILGKVVFSRHVDFVALLKWYSLFAVDIIRNCLPRLSTDIRSTRLRRAIQRPGFTYFFA
jgi:hypothetical protein